MSSFTLGDGLVLAVLLSSLTFVTFRMLRLYAKRTPVPALVRVSRRK
jgi:uncharacterized membrane protein (UPF0136 family)